MVAGLKSPQATMHPPSWQSALQTCGGLQLMVQVTVSRTIEQFIWHGPGSQVGLQDGGPSQLKLQLVPEQLTEQSWSPVQPGWQYWVPHSGWQSGPVPGQMGGPPSLPPSEPWSGPPSVPPSVPVVTFEPTTWSMVQARARPTARTGRTATALLTGAPGARR